MTMKHKDFCALILTHGRPDNIKTLPALRKAGYTGKVLIVIDDEDKRAQEYRSRFGSMVHQFCKKEVAARIDECDNFNDRRAILYARNAAFDIAKKAGYRYFIQLDDDYQYFTLRVTIDDALRDIQIRELDYVFDRMLEYFISAPAMTSLAMSQNGDFIGGASNGLFDSLLRRRKAMNTFICDTERRFEFTGRLNEDVNTYTAGQSRGLLFLTLPDVAIKQTTTQASSGGMTDAYAASGTYVKSFYSVMQQPASVRIALMGEEHPRLHHKIDWRNTVPHIIPESFRKI